MTGKQIAKRPARSSYTSEIERGLSAVALVQGNTRRAAAALKAEGLAIPRTTLQDWTTKTQRDRYMAISEDELPHTYRRIAESNEALAERLLRLEDEAADKLASALEDDGLPADKISTALRNIAVSAGIAIDKASVIRGRPTEIRTTQSAAEIMRAINERFGHVLTLPTELIEIAAIEEESGRFQRSVLCGHDGPDSRRRLLPESGCRRLRHSERPHPAAVTRTRGIVPERLPRK